MSNAGRKAIPNRSRRAIAVKLRNPVDAAVRARAEQLGMPAGELVSHFTAVAMGMPQHAPELPVIDDPQGDLFDPSREA